MLSLCIDGVFTLTPLSVWDRMANNSWHSLLVKNGLLRYGWVANISYFIPRTLECPSWILFRFFKAASLTLVFVCFLNASLFIPLILSSSISKLTDSKFYFLSIPQSPLVMGFLSFNMSVFFMLCHVSQLFSPLFTKKAWRSSRPISALYLPRGMSCTIAQITETLATALTYLSAIFAASFPFWWITLQR